MQQELPQQPVVFMRVPQVVHAGGQLCMVEAQIHTILAKCCVVVRIMATLMERV